MNDKFKNIAAMSIFGTIGLFRRYISLPSSFIAMIRGLLGMLFLVLFVLLTKRRISKEAIRNNLIPLFLSGIFLGLNWMLLFESYNYTSVAVATLCYYMAPIFIVIASPFVLKEKIPFKKKVAVVIALIGMVLVSGALSKENNFSIIGVAFGLLAAVFYTLVVFINKGINSISAYDKTIVQLSVSTLALLPYVLLKETLAFKDFNLFVLFMLLIVGIIHTGVAYALYFDSIKGLKAQEIAIFSYIDPILAIIISAFVLFEPIDFIQITGIILVLGSTIFSELSSFDKIKK